MPILAKKRHMVYNKHQMDDQPDICFPHDQMETRALPGSTPFIHLEETFGAIPESIILQSKRPEVPYPYVQQLTEGEQHPTAAVAYPVALKTVSAYKVDKSGFWIRAAGLTSLGLKQPRNILPADKKRPKSNSEPPTVLQRHRNL